MFGIGLDILVGVFTTDETFGVEDCVLGIGRQLILGGVTDQTFIIRRKRNVRRRDSLETRKELTMITTKREFRMELRRRLTTSVIQMESNVLRKKLTCFLGR